MSGSSPADRLRHRRRRLLAAAGVLGPGLIAAVAGNDAGGVTTYASAGAQFGYRTLFLMLWVTVALVVVQEMSARLGAYTGEGLMSLIREQFSLRLGALAIVALVLANAALVVSEFAGIGAAFELWGVSRFISVPLAAVALWLVVTVGSYRWAERIFIFLSLAFIAYPVAAVLGRPDWGEVARQTFAPQLLAQRDFFVLAVALVGTTITPYMQLYQAAGVVDAGIGPDDYRRARIDSVSGSIFANVVSMAIIIATAAALGGTGALGSAAEAAKALGPVAGRGAEVLFGLGLLGASALAAAVVPLATSYALAEAIGVERSASSSIREAPQFFGIFTVLVVVGAVGALIPGNLITFLVNLQVVQGILSPVVLVFILILANRRSVLGDAVNGPRFNVVAVVSVVAVATMAVVFVAQSLLG